MRDLQVVLVHGDSRHEEGRGGGGVSTLDERLAALSVYLGFVRDCTHGEAAVAKYSDFVDAISEARELIAGSLAPGWWCTTPGCLLFNGDLKVRLTECRGCGAPRA
jgi:hypothetical protein